MRYAYLNARVSILASRLLASEALERLVGGESVTVPDGGSIETGDTLVQRVLTNFAVVVRGADGTDRDLLVHMTRWFELANVKALIRGKIAGLPADALREHLLPLGIFSTLPLESLLRVEDAGELLRRLETTPYADVARHARNTLEQGGQLAAVDAAIDRQYLTGLRKRAAAVARVERTAVQALADVVLDWTAIVWLLRYRFAYGFSPAETWYQLVPSERALTGERLQRLVQLDSAGRVLEALPPTIAARVEGATSVAEMENKLERDAWQRFEAALHRPGAPLARAFAYVLRGWMELRRVSAIQKGHDLGLAPDLIRFAAHLEA